MQIFDCLISIIVDPKPVPCSYTEVYKLQKRGWPTALVDGPFVVKRIPSRAGLLDESSSVSSATTIVRAALIRRVTKRSTRPQLSCFPLKISVNSKKRVCMSLDVL